MEQLDIAYDPPRKTRADQIEEAFKKFHAANPIVYELFERFTLQVTGSGRENYSVNAIFERIRWHMDIEIVASAVKLNNNFRAYYGRMFEAKHPELEGVFRKRVRISKDRPAYKNDIQVFNAGPPGDEGELKFRLSQL